MAPILGADGRPLSRRGWYDTEALAEDGGTVYVGIERVNQIVRFDYGKDGLRARGQPIAVPPGMKALPHNQSIECLAVAPQGRPLAGTLIAISERGLDARRQHAGLSDRRRRAAARSRSSAPTNSTSATARSTPRGELLVLERRFSWMRGVAMRIRSVPLARDQARRAGRRAGADLRRHGPPDRQHGRPVGAPRRRRRAGADADLRRQFLAAAADRCCCSSRWRGE